MDITGFKNSWRNTEVADEDRDEQMDGGGKLFVTYI